MSYPAIEVLRGDPVVLDVTLTRDGADWTSAETFTPVAQVRSKAGAAVAAEWDLTFTGNVMTMTLKTAAIPGGLYVSDVEFHDPDEDDPELAVFTWPGPGQDRLVLDVTEDVTRITGS